MQKTERGKFRSIEVDDLIKWAEDKQWDAETSRNRYIYPMDINPKVATQEGLRLAVGNPPEETYRRGVYVCATSPQSHKGPFKHAIDFLVPDGTPILSADGGTVIEIQEHSETWGDSEEFRDFLNYITIQHEHGEYSQYCHLAKNSATENGIGVGSRVSRGQRIARVRKTGWTDRDHLHFLVFRTGVHIGPFTFKSLVPKFK